jgi:hypothetical protein
LHHDVQAKNAVFACATFAKRAGGVALFAFTWLSLTLLIGVPATMLWSYFYGIYHGIGFPRAIDDSLAACVVLGGLCFVVSGFIVAKIDLRLSRRH